MVNYITPGEYLHLKQSQAKHILRAPGGADEQVLEIREGDKTYTFKYDRRESVIDIEVKDSKTGAALASIAVDFSPNTIIKKESCSEEALDEIVSKLAPAVRIQ